MLSPTRFRFRVLNSEGKDVRYVHCEPTGVNIDVYIAPSLSRNISFNARLAIRVAIASISSFVTQSVPDANRQRLAGEMLSDYRAQACYRA